MRRLRAEYRRLTAVVTEFISPTAPNQPSPMAITAEALSAMVARAITAQLKTTLMGMESGASRGEKAVQGDLALDIAGQTPLGAVLGAFPRLSKTLRKNPGLLDFALGAISKVGAGRGAPATPDTSNGDRPRFHL